MVSTLECSNVACAQLAAGPLVPSLPQQAQAFRAGQNRGSGKKMCQGGRRLSQDEKEQGRAADLGAFAAPTAQHHTAASWSGRRLKDPYRGCENPGRRNRLVLAAFVTPLVGLSGALGAASKVAKRMAWALSGIGLAI